MQKGHYYLTLQLIMYSERSYVVAHDAKNGYMSGAISDNLTVCNGMWGVRYT